MNAEEILALLTKGNSRISKEGFSTRDIVAVSTLSRRRVSELMQEAFDRGLLEYAGKRREPRRDGSMVHTPVYRFSKGATGLMKQQGMPCKPRRKG